MAKKRIDGLKRDKAWRDRYFRDSLVHGARLVAKGQSRDHIAERPWKHVAYSPLQYRNLLRCPELVFAGYGEGLQ
jgi:hypothetical protein